jgi:putative ATPase
LAADAQRTVLFVEEIHRWNRAQQDAFLPHVESGLLMPIGATRQASRNRCQPPRCCC